MLLLRTLLALCLAAGLTACATERAQGLQTSAYAFRDQATTAINGLDTMRRREVEVPPSPSPETDFLANVQSIYSSNIAFNDSVADRLADPDAVAQNQATADAWSSYLAALRLQYDTFASIFDTLPAAGGLGRDAIGRAVPQLDALIAEMTVLGQRVAHNPPRFLGRRAALVADFTATRTATLSDADRRARLLAWRSAWLTLQADERDLQRTTVENCLQTVVLGIALRRQIQEFQTVNLQEVASSIRQTLGLLGTASGRDVTALQGRVDAIAARVQNDPDLAAASSLALERVQAAAGGR